MLDGSSTIVIAGTEATGVNIGRSGITTAILGTGTASLLEFLDSGDSKFVALQAPSTQSTASVTYTLPSVPASTGLTLTSDTSGIMTWISAAGISLAAVGSSPNANAATLTGDVLNLQPANGSFPGVVTTSAQTIAGQKTFSSNLLAPQASATTPGYSFTSATGDGMYYDTSSNAVAIATGGAQRWLGGKLKTGLTNNSSNNILQVAGFTAKTYGGLVVDFDVDATDGTDVQSASGTLIVAAQQKSTTASGTTTMNYTVSTSTGTLTLSFGVTSGTNQITVTCTPASSLTTTGLQIATTISTRNASALTVTWV